MAHEEYHKVYTEDNESFASSQEASHQCQCERCTASIHGIAGASSSKQQSLGGASLFQVCTFVLLLTANLGTIGLWWRANHRATDCVRPLLTYCIDPIFTHGTRD